MRMIVIENDKLRVAILAGKGTDIVELNYKPLDLDFVWLAPGGVRNPQTFAATAPDVHATFRDNYPGGWQEMLPNAGTPSTFEGASLPQHGELYNVPWDVAIAEDTEDLAIVSFTAHARRSPFVVEKTIRLDSGIAGFRIDERLTNISHSSAYAMWGHHITFGPPFLRPGCRIHLPDGVMVSPHSEPIAPGGRRVSSTAPFSWPRDSGTGEDLRFIPGPGAPSELCYLSGFSPGKAWYEIMDDERDIAARLSWDAETMPYLWYWQEFGRSTGYPWWGRLFNIGLEPCSSYPSMGLKSAVENGTALKLGPLEERTFSLQMEVVPIGAGR
jgi:hypothetical protein